MSDPICPDAGSSGYGWSYYGAFGQCPQLFAYLYLLRLGGALPTGRALKRGSLVHLGLATYYLRLGAKLGGLDYEGQEITHPDQIMRPGDAMRLVAAREGWRDQLQVSLDATRAYVDNIAKKEDIYQVVSVERKLVAHIHRRDEGLPAIPISTRIDLEYRNRLRRVIVADHKCLPGCAKVQTRQGVERVDVLASMGGAWSCAAWNEHAHSTVWTKAGPPQPAGVQPIYEIGFSHGVAERYGHTHPLLTEQGWVEAAQVRLGMWVAQAAPPNRANDSAIPDDVLRVVGLALSDGGRVKDGPGNYVVTAHNPKVRAYLTDALDRLGDSWAPHTHKDQVKGVRLHQGGTADAAIRAWGLQRKLAGDKHFPRALTGLSYHQVGVLLGALWEGDGAAYLGTPGANGRRPVRIVFSSRSRALSEGVQGLLLQLDVLSNVTESRVVGAPYYQTVVVGHASKLRFLRLALSGVVDCPVTREGGRKTRRGRTLEPLKEVLDHHVATKRRPSSSRARNPHWEDGVRWVKVVACKCVGEAECYDIEVPRYHTFLTSTGTVTHNTTMLNFTKALSRYTLSGQFSLLRQFAAARHGDSLDSVKCNLVPIDEGRAPRKPQRKPVPRAPEIDRGFADSIRWMQGQIETLVESGRDPWRWPRVMSDAICNHYGECPGYKFCQWGREAGCAHLGLDPEMYKNPSPEGVAHALLTGDDTPTI